MNDEGDAFGFSAVTDNCVFYTHRHHAYWRLDFDIDGPDGDVVTESPNPTPGPPKRGRRPRTPPVSPTGPSVAGTGQPTPAMAGAPQAAGPVSPAPAANGAAGADAISQIMGTIGKLV